LIFHDKNLENVRGLSVHRLQLNFSIHPSYLLLRQVDANLRTQRTYYIPEAAIFQGGLIHHTSVVKIFDGFFDRIENDPVSPNDRPVLPAGQLDSCVAMILITIVIMRVRYIFGHFLNPPYILEIPGHLNNLGTIYSRAV
jgi:hypothetical protein